MILLTTLAFAGEPAPAPADVVPVSDLRWAVSFQLDEATPYTMMADAPAITEGWVLELHADPRLLTGTQIDQAVLYVNGTPARRMNWGNAAGCAVVIVPGPVDLATARVFFGSTTLPERVTEAHGERELVAAMQANVPALGAAVAGRATQSATWTGVSMDTVFERAEDQVASCTSAQPAGRTRD